MFEHVFQLWGLTEQLYLHNIVKTATKFILVCVKVFYDSIADSNN